MKINIILCIHILRLFYSIEVMDSTNDYHKLKYSLFEIHYELYYSDFIGI